MGQPNVGAWVKNRISANSPDEECLSTSSLDGRMPREAYESSEDRHRRNLLAVGVPVLLILGVLVFFYSVFYFPNRTTAISGTIVSSGQEREYLL